MSSPSLDVGKVKDDEQFISFGFHGRISYDFELFPPFKHLDIERITVDKTALTPQHPGFSTSSTNDCKQEETDPLRGLDSLRKNPPTGKKGQQLIQTVQQGTNGKLKTTWASQGKPNAIAQEIMREWSAGPKAIPKAPLPTRLPTPDLSNCRPCLG
ncbi:hypothetical protein PAAG_06904 [Paracoccidioides lutzii Pb01]|uniref:Uncharacterized protein n=1 Tax=Paracoccidioides lutzii (strain ATCC MYA-826 / Pb01) TaxID=502779 RepID=C1H813_PARBA|nr:hypothetical protein PAAG_06904 [Paracoccidioides lutzii Pb01]EEH36486.2 hypothetical protein PAAG_06904 [Paracoccidioides lutzii Pb01]